MHAPHEDLICRCLAVFGQQRRVGAALRNVDDFRRSVAVNLRKVGQSGFDLEPAILFQCAGDKRATALPGLDNAVTSQQVNCICVLSAGRHHGGWAAANDYYEPNKETLAKLIRGWADANDYIIANSNEAMEKLQKGHYSQTPLADINESFKAQKMFTSRDWKRLYSDGTVTNWLQQTTDFFMANANIKDFTPASKYFDPSLYLKTIA